MKIYFLEIGILMGLGVQGVVIPGMVERLVGRHHRHNGGVNKAAVLSSQSLEAVGATPVASLDLNTVVGNGAGLVGAATVTGSSSSTDSTLSANTASLTLPTGILAGPLTSTDSSLSTSTSTDSTTRSRRTVTVTKTEIALASTTTTIAAETNTATPVVQTASNSAGFGGVVGALSNDTAPTAGSVVTVVGGQSGFGGVVGAVVTTESSTASTATSDTTSSTSTDSTITTVASSTVARGVGAFGGIVGLDSSVSTATDSSSSAATLDSTTASTALFTTTTVAEGVGAFGGIVGLDANPTNLVSTATTFAGFGGVVGVAVVSTDVPAVRKRDTFTTELSLNFGGGASSTSDTFTAPSNSVIFPVAAASPTTVAGDDVVIVTQTTTIDPVVTVFAGPSTQTPNSTTSFLDSTITSATSTVSNATSTDSGADVVTVTETVTSTLSAPTSSPTILSIGDLFPNCANFTSNVTSLANITIPNIVLPSNLTLAQVFGVSGENIDCGTLLNLLGVNVTAPVKRRGVYKRAFRYRLK